VKNTHDENFDSNGEMKRKKAREERERSISFSLDRQQRSKDVEDKTGFRHLARRSMDKPGVLRTDASNLR
jgi:hypothetical protein